MSRTRPNSGQDVYSTLRNEWVHSICYVTCKGASMPTSNAERQKAFRERLRQRLAAVDTPAPLPDKPKLSAMPANKRWAALLDQAKVILTIRRDEMQEYFDDRSETWQEGEKGAAFQERLDAMESVLDELDGQE